MKFFDLNLSHIPEVMAIESAAHVTPWTEKVVTQSFGPRSVNFGLFEHKGQLDCLLGYVFCNFVAGELSLENICVAPEYQGRKLGQKLMTKLMQKADELNAESIWLEVRASNLNAISLYQKSGFEQVSVRKDYYKLPGTNQKEDALLMKFSLV